MTRKGHCEELSVIESRNWAAMNERGKEKWKLDTSLGMDYPKSIFASWKMKGHKKLVCGLIATVIANKLLTSKLRTWVNSFSVSASFHFWKSLVKCKTFCDSILYPHCNGWQCTMIWFFFIPSCFLIFCMALFCYKSHTRNFNSVKDSW